MDLKDFNRTASGRIARSNYYPDNPTISCWFLMEFHKIKQGTKTISMKIT
jgi:hypothetical protein